MLNISHRSLNCFSFHFTPVFTLIFHVEFVFLAQRDEKTHRAATGSHHENLLHNTPIIVIGSGQNTIRRVIKMDLSKCHQTFMPWQILRPQLTDEELRVQWLLR